MKRTLALALVMGLSTGAYATTLAAAGLQHKGTPEPLSTPMSTYGIEVPVRTALKSLVPTGWRMFIHKSAVLPSALSWKPGDQWTEVLSDAAAAQGLSVLLDWDLRAVMVRPVDVAMQEGAVRAQAMQAASTPLPRFTSVAKPTPAVAAVPTAAASAPLAVAAASVAEPVPAPTPVVVVEAATAPQAPVVLAVAPAIEAALASAPVAVAAAPQAPLVAPALEPVAAPTPIVVVEPAVAPQAPAVAATAPVLEAAPVSAPVVVAEATAAPQAPVEPVAAPTPAMVVEPAAAPQAPAVAATAPVLEAAPVSAPVAVAEAIAAPQAPVVVAPASAAAPVLAGVVEAATASPVAVTAPEVPRSPRFHVANDGTLTADSAFTALAVAAEQRPLPTTAAEPGPAGIATVLAMRETQDAPMPAATPAPSRLAVNPDSTPVETSRSPAPAHVAEPSTATPLGTIEASVQANAGLLSTAPQLTAPAMKADLPTLQVFMVNPTPPMVAERDKVEAASPPPVLKSTADFAYTKPVALNKPAVRTVAQGIAARFGVRLVWVAPDINLEGPVTLLSASLEQDVGLLRKALGRYGPVTLDILGEEVRVTSKDPAFVARHQALAAQEALQRAMAQAAEAKLAQEQGAKAAADAASRADVPMAEAKPGRSGAVGALGVDLAASRQPAAIQLVIEPGDTLEQGLKRIMQARGYTHEWKVVGGFEANRRLTYEASTLTELLTEVLPPLGISADIYTLDNHIVIRPGDYRE